MDFSTFFMLPQPPQLFSAMGGSGSRIKTGSAHRDRIILFGDSITQQSLAEFKTESIALF